MHQTTERRASRPRRAAVDALRLPAALLAGVLLLAGCGADDSTDDPGEAETSGKTGTTTASPTVELLRLPSEVVVLGDSSSSAVGDWPGQWCASLVDERTCQTRQWDFKLEEFVSQWSNFGGQGPRMRIWNLSQPGATAEYPQQRDRLAAITGDPDVVILNYGYTQTPENVVSATSDLAAAVEERWPDAQVVVTLQNPVTTDAVDQQEQRVSELREWAESERLPVIDVWSAFDEQPELGSLLLDGAQPNELGTKVWVEAVRAAFE